VHYVMPRIPGQRPAPKISYVRLYKKLNWVLGTGVYISDIIAEKNARLAALTEQTNQIMFIMILVSLLILLFAFVIIYLFSRIIIRPINENIGFLRLIAEGKGDFT